MSKVIWNTWFLAYEDNGPVAYVISRVLFQCQKIVNQLALILDIELHHTYRSIFQSLNYNSKTPGLVNSVIVIISLLLGFIVTYNVAFLWSCICERHRIGTCQQQPTLFHYLHPDKTRTSVIVCKYLRMQYIYPLHELLCLLSRSRSFRISFTV